MVLSATPKTWRLLPGPRLAARQPCQRELSPAFSNVSLMFRVSTLLRLIGVPFVAAKTGLVSGFPQRSLCACNIFETGLMRGTAPLLRIAFGPVDCPSQIDCVTLILVSLQSCLRNPQISPRLSPVNAATAKIVAAGSGSTARIARISSGL